MISSITFTTALGSRTYSHSLPVLPSVGEIITLNGNFKIVPWGTECIVKERKISFANESSRVATHIELILEAIEN